MMFLRLMEVLPSYSLLLRAEVDEADSSARCMPTAGLGSRRR